ncbi:MAG: cohesin domain-containing protein [Candidatus Bathyarchaeota archaeon]|nr:cohesin domain-containing protein [Candidatus Bathyarchaeota archaeon]
MNNTKKLWILVLILTLATTSQVRTNATSQTVVKVEPYQNVAGIGQQFNVSITIADVQNLFAVETQLYWNNSILHLGNAEPLLGVESHPEGVLYNDSQPIFVNETIGSGEYLLNATSIGTSTPSFNGSGTITKLTFNVVDIGSCELVLQTLLYNKATSSEPASQIPHSKNNGYYSPIYITALPLEVNLGERVKVLGYIEALQESVNVTIQYLFENETSWVTLENVTASSQGDYESEWIPPREGTHQIKAVTTIQEARTESAIASISVKPLIGGPWFLYLLACVLFIMIAIAIFIIYRKRR